MIYKKCTKCGKDKPIDEFYQYKMGGKNYRRGACNKCWHKQIVDLKRFYQKIPDGFFYSIKSNAKKRNITFTLKRKEFIEWWNIQKLECFYCKRTLKEIQMDIDKNNKNASRLSIDRIDNNKGYTFGNIVLSCWRCNSIKSDFFDKKEMLIIGEMVRRKFRKLSKSYSS